MISYEVKYKKVNGIFWKKLKNIIGDGFVPNQNTRLFYLEDKSYVEIDCSEMIFKFSRERFYAIKDSMEKEASQPIQTN